MERENRENFLLRSSFQFIAFKVNVEASARLTRGTTSNSRELSDSKRREGALMGIRRSNAPCFPGNFTRNSLYARWRARINGWLGRGNCIESDGIKHAIIEMVEGDVELEIRGGKKKEKEKKSTSKDVEAISRSTTLPSSLAELVLYSEKRNRFEHIEPRRLPWKIR